MICYVGYSFVVLRCVMMSAVEGQTRSKVTSLALTLALLTRACHWWRERVPKCWRTVKERGRRHRWSPSRRTARGLWELRPDDRPLPTPRIHCTLPSAWLDDATTTQKSRRTCKLGTFVSEIELMTEISLLEMIRSKTFLWHTLVTFWY